MVEWQERQPVDDPDPSELTQLEETEAPQQRTSRRMAPALRGTPTPNCPSPSPLWDLCLPRPPNAAAWRPRYTSR